MALCLALMLPLTASGTLPAVGYSQANGAGGNEAALARYAKMKPA